MPSSTVTRWVRTGLRAGRQVGRPVRRSNEAACSWHSTGRALQPALRQGGVLVGAGAVDGVELAVSIEGRRWAVLCRCAAAAAAPAWNIYFGDLHQHTNLSDGDVVPEELLRRVRSSGVLDFMALSDHSQYFDSPEDWTKSQEWAEVKRLADVHTEPGKFVVLAAFEWSKNSREGGSGHINTFGTDWYASADAKVWKTDVKSYYQKLADDPRPSPCSIIRA